ncbi:MAG: LytR/AlgR family response regulator transcription factor [Comamonas sp.]
MRILIVDDETLARSRLARLLGEAGLAPGDIHEAARADEALQRLAQAGPAFDVLLLDIHMPGQSGLAMAQALAALPAPPEVIFVTAHAEHALQAFDLNAVDYLTKPVRLERLQQALAKLRRSAMAPEPADDGEALLIHDRGRTERVPLAEVLYLKAEQKYITVRTARRSYIMDGSLNELELRHTGRFLRVHRNALVARGAMRAVEKYVDPESGEGWGVRLQGLPERLPISRRQLAAVREEIAR